MAAPLAHLPHGNRSVEARDPEGSVAGIAPDFAPDSAQDLGPDFATDFNGWRADALGGSQWVTEVAGLSDFAEELYVEGGERRRAAIARSSAILEANPGRDLTRAMSVGFEMFVQSIALALDIRDVSRLEGLTLRGWVKDHTQSLRGSRSRLVSDAFDPRTRAERVAEQELGDPDASRAMLARRLRIAAEALGPTFVKFGQILGSSAGLLPQELVSEFGRCRDEVRPEKPSAIRRVVEDELGPIAARFSSFDPTPIASASIAQVHAARLRGGQEVVVKVQRPGVRRLMERDAALLYRAARAIDGVELMETANLPGMVELFAGCVSEELDFRLEAENMIDFALALEHSGTDVVVPRPVPGMVTERALVMERLDGRPISTSGDAGLPVFKVGTQAVLDTALTYGLFHADLHAGNILAMRDGRFGLVDFGIVGRFDPSQRLGLSRWLLSFAGDDLSAQLAALDDLGAFPDGVDLSDAHDQIDAVITKVATVESLDVDQIASHFELIARILTHHGMRLPKELALFFKNLIHVSGAVASIVPESAPGEEMSDLLEGVRARHA